MRHADIRATMNTYGEVVTDEMAQSASKVVRLALNRAQTERKVSGVPYFGRSVCESNTPATSKMPPAGFEDHTVCSDPL